MLFTLAEFFDVIVMTTFIGFIFKDFFRPIPKTEHYDPLITVHKGFDWHNFLFACYVIAPAIVLHELAHKFVGLSFGLQSTFHAAYMWLAIGLILKMINFGFIFFVPAYVSTVGVGTHLQFAAISVAGPLMNLVLWLSTAAILKFGTVKRKYIPFIALTARINMFLFIFNMIPIVPFDGGSFFYHLWQAFV
jgi:Zn-dependent protease